jgi:hypothetical protein
VAPHQISTRSRPNPSRKALQSKPDRVFESTSLRHAVSSAENLWSLDPEMREKGGLSRHLLQEPHQRNSNVGTLCFQFADSLQRFTLRSRPADLPTSEALLEWASDKRVFISNGMSVLKAERLATSKAIRTVGARPVMFEEFAERDADPEQTYLTELESSDIYLGI